jgi:hypothetical protein
MLSDGRMIAGMAIIAAMILVAPAYACDDNRFPCPPKGLQRNPFSLLFGQGAVERPAQKRVRLRTRAPANVAAPKRKPAEGEAPATATAPVPAPAAPAVTPPPTAAATPSAPPASAPATVTPAAPSATPGVPPAPAAMTPPTPAATPGVPPAPAALAPLASPATASAPPTPSAAVTPLAPVQFTPAAELVRIIKQSELPDPTSGVVWIVSPNEVNHIDLQAGHVVLVTKGSENDVWSAPWFQRLLATIGGALAAASAFRLFFA